MPKDSENSRYFTTTSLSSHLGVTRLTLGRWRSVGYGPPFYKIGREFRYLKSKVYKWELEQENGQ